MVNAGRAQAETEADAKDGEAGDAFTEKGRGEGEQESGTREEAARSW